MIVFDKEERWKDLQGRRQHVLFYRVSGRMAEVEGLLARMADWCRANCAGQWEQESNSGVFWFVENDDATLFRLRFG